jgi:hypothetical protein
MTKFQKAIVLILAIFCGLAAYGGFLRTKMDKKQDQYIEALKILVKKYEAVGDSCADDDDKARQAMAEASKELEIKFQEKWGETYREYIDRGGSNEIGQFEEQRHPR